MMAIQRNITMFSFGGLCCCNSYRSGITQAFHCKQWLAYPNKCFFGMMVAENC